MNYFDAIGMATLIRFEQDQLDKRLDLLRQIASTRPESTAGSSPVTRLVLSLRDVGRRLGKVDRPTGFRASVVELRSELPPPPRDERAA